MAAFSKRPKQRILIMKLPMLLGVVFCLCICKALSDIPSTNSIQEWAKVVDDKLYDLNTKFHHIAKPYTDRANLTDDSLNFTAEYKTIKELDLVKEMSSTLAEMLERKMHALNNSVQTAEKVAANYTWNKRLQKDDVHYVNSKEMLANGMPLERDDRFGEVGVNFNYSSVHIPVEIYDGNIDILNGLNWSQALEETFKENYEKDPEILWQYFGSQTGFMRTYPATQWPDRDVDLYDVRRQSWYTQGSSSPKDMMILVDTSGSTHGQSLQLMQNAVKSILDTLGENDFVNIVDFAETAKFSSKCLNRTAFVQANYRNKKQLEKDVDHLDAKGQADFTEAIKFAFEKFEEFKVNETDDETTMGANCNKVIMLLTDGGTDNARDVFNKYNWPNKTVRVFTYAVGPTPNPIHAVRWMACANRGYFSQIPAMGAIRTRVQEYTDHMKAIYEAAEVQAILWELTFDSRGLGMMTTVTMPVYNRSNADGSSNQTILGVMGVDVTTAELESKTPYPQIGPNGYSFAINPNGYVVFHPNLKTGGEFMNEPPNVDLMEMEIHREDEDDELDGLRTQMIQGNEGQQTIPTMFLSHDQRYVVATESRFAYTDIRNTTFRLGLSVPTYQVKYLALDFDSKLKNLSWPETSTEDYHILIAPWNYYKNMSKMRDEMTGTLTDIINLTSTDSNESHWNMDLVLHLYWDIQMTIKNFRNDPIPPSDKMFFAISNGGMTMFDADGDIEYMRKLSDPRKSSLYKRAQHSQGCVLEADYTQELRLNTSADPKVTMACSVSIEDSGTVINKPIVSGVRMNYTTVMKEVQEAIDGFDVDKSHCSDIDLSLSCYLVDTGGFLVASNREDSWEQIGRFFGQVDPPVMQTMINKSYFVKSTQYDFQAACDVTKDSTSSGFRNFNIPSISFNVLFEVLNAGWWTSRVSWALANFNLFSWLLSPSPIVLAQSEAKQKPCVKAFQQYYLADPTPDTMYPAFNGGFTCDNCTRNFTAVYMRQTNLLLIISDALCDQCEGKFESITQAPREVPEEEEEKVICRMAESPRKRVPPEGCYHIDPREDSKQCGCASIRLSGLAMLVIIASVMWSSNLR